MIGRPWHAVIVAGGTGSRFGADRPKQFITFRDAPVIVWTARAFLDMPDLKSLVVVSHVEWIDTCREMLAPLSTSYPDTAIRVIEGGNRRQDSVRLGVNALACADDAPVLIHDAARPLVVPSLIRRVLQAVRTAGAAIPVIPHADSIVAVENGIVTEYPDRSRSARVQTPQGFLFHIIRESHAMARNDSDPGAVDDGSLAVNAGYPVVTIDGDGRNIKITRSEDLAIIERLWPDEPQTSHRS